jgi:glucan phosphoethanolaminetransferase (alkaline phosphatase superfamily)
MSGVALNMRQQPRAYAWYSVYVVASYYITYFSVFLDYLRIRSDLEESMKNVRMLFGMGLAAWMHLCIRYFRLQFLATFAPTAAVTCFQIG